MRIQFTMAGLLMLLAVQAGYASSHRNLVVPVPPEVAPKGAHAPRPICTPSSGDKWSCRNWAGTVEWTPASLVIPSSEEELSTYLASTGAAGAPVKVVGYAHSWAGLYIPANGADGAPGATIALHSLAGITRLDAEAGEVEVLAGTSFARLFEELGAKGLTLAWSPGGIQGLTVGGAVSVGFHGSQLSLGGVSSVVSALRVYDTATGAPHDLSEATHPEEMRAARMGLGMCGVLSRVTLPVVPQFHLRRRRWRVDDAAAFLGEQLHGLKQAYDRFHYYVHPATGSAWPMTWEPATAEEAAAEGRPCKTALEQEGDAKMTEFGPDGLPLIMRWDNCSDISYKSLTHAVDMDAQPLWNGELYVVFEDDAAEAAAVATILEKFRTVAAERAAATGGASAGPNTDVWLHVRYVGGDTASLLNPCYGLRSCAAIELALVAHTMKDGLPPWDEWAAYMHAMEDVLAPMGGRPHWAKYSSRRPGLFAAPGLGLPVDEFRSLCKKYDPAGRLRSAAFEGILTAGPAAPGAKPAVAPARTKGEL